MDFATEPLLDMARRRTTIRTVPRAAQHREYELPVPLGDSGYVVEILRPRGSGKVGRVGRDSMNYAMLTA